MLPMNPRVRNPHRPNVTTPASVPVSSWTNFTPASLQPTLWLDASDDSTITSSSGAVSEWRDKSANAFVFQQATSTAQPTTGIKTQNGLNVLSFDGGDSLVSTELPSKWTLFHNGTRHIYGVVVKRDVAGTNGTVFCTTIAGSSTGGLGIGVRFLAANAWSYYIRPTDTGVALFTDSLSVGTSTAFRVISGFVDSANASYLERTTIQIDGGAESKPNTSTSTAAPSTTDPARTLWIGNRDVSALPLTGAIAEIVIVCGPTATNANRQRLHRYLNAKWAIY